MADLNCHSIKSYINEFRGGLPNGHNKTAVSVKKETLSVSIRSSDGEKNGDIFTLVCRLKNISFGEANKYLHKLFGLQYKYNRKNKIETDKTNPLEVFQKHLRTRYIVNRDAPVYDEGIIREYVHLPHIDWIKEGVMPFACKRFNIGYSYDRRRIIIPWRRWDGGDNEYVGIVGRTTIQNYDLLDIPKFFAIQSFEKKRNIYGLNENYNSIQEAGYTCVFEAEKSVLKRYSRKDKTGVAIGCHTLSPEQVRILIGLNTDIIICYDKGISLNYIRSECEKFWRIRNVFYVYDKWDLLKGEKDSPADAPDKVYKFLLKHKVEYNENERKLYLRWREKQGKN